MERHDRALLAVYYDLCKHYCFEVMPRWWELQTLPVRENHHAKILWDIPIPTDRDIVACHPDVFLQDKMNRHLYLIEMAVAWDSILEERRAEKQSKYRELCCRFEKTVPRLPYGRSHSDRGLRHSHPPSGGRSAPSPYRGKSRVTNRRDAALCAVFLCANTEELPLSVRAGEHKQAVKRGDPRNGIAVHAHQCQHTFNWDGAKVKRRVSGYWKRRTTEAIHIRLSEGTMNLDNDLQLPTMWNPILNPP